MASRKKDIDFNEYFDFLWHYAQSKKITKGHFMKNAGLSPQRFSEFSQSTRNITGDYFLKMITGLGLSPEDVERKSGLPFSEEQGIQIRFDGFVKSQRTFLEELMKDPAKLRLCKTIVTHKGFSDNRYIKRLLLKFTKDTAN